MNYEEMSDYEINKAVAKNLGYKIMPINSNGKCGFASIHHKRYPNTVWIGKCDNFGTRVQPWEQFCPTSTPNEAWPIIEKNRINMVAPNCGSMWRIFINVNGISCCHSYHENGLRAAMIAYLKMNEE